MPYSSQSAYVDEIAGEGLYQSLFEEDTEAAKLILLPGEDKRMAEYKQFFLDASNELEQLGLQEATHRRTEREDFFECYSMAVTANQSLSTARVAEYDEHWEKVRFHF